MTKHKVRSPRSPEPPRTASIVGTGSYTPSRVLTNADLEKIVETSDEWIVTRTGIRERRIAAPNEATSDMASKAGAAALEQAGIKAEEVDLLIVATVSPDMWFPSTACFVQRKLGAKNATCFDISAACAGFLYGLETAQQFITSRTKNTALVIGADKLSALVDWTDRNTCVLFGDGAGAAVLRNRGDVHGLLVTTMGSDGTQTDLLQIPVGGSATPLNSANINDRMNTIKMAGREVFKHAVNAMVRASFDALDHCGLTPDDIACVIPHQANMRIIEAVGERIKVPIDRFFVNLDKYGNTSAAAVAIALDEANRTGRIRKGDYVLLVVFGGGLTWASSVIQW